MGTADSNGSLSSRWRDNRRSLRRIVLFRNFLLISSALIDIVDLFEIWNRFSRDSGWWWKVASQVLAMSMIFSILELAFGRSAMTSPSRRPSAGRKTSIDSSLIRPSGLEMPR
jgi:hypothetical protein